MSKSWFFLFLSMVGIAAMGEPGPSATAGAGDAPPRAYLPFLTAPPADVPFGPLHTGEGTYYVEADGGGNCSFDPLPDDLLVAALNNTDYGNADLCGGYLLAQGPAGSVLVRIVDRCPGCAPGDVDFSPQAFAQIADLPQGRVPISWQLISPPLAGPVGYHFHPDSNQWWTAVQIRNHRNPVSALAYWNGAQWINAPRTLWNYFIAPGGMGPGPFTFRLTDIFGNTLIDGLIPHLAGSTIYGAAQLPSP